MLCFITSWRRSRSRAGPKALPRVSAATLVVMGDADPDFGDPEAEARWAAGRIGGSYRMITGAGHYPMADRATELVSTIAAAMRVYELEGDDLTDAVRMLRSLLHGFITLEQNGGFKDPRNIDRSFERIVGSLDPIFRNWNP